MDYSGYGFHKDADGWQCRAATVVKGKILYTREKKRRLRDGIGKKVAIREK